MEFKNYIQKTNVHLSSNILNWKEAIKLGAKSLLIEGKITKNYIDKIISNVYQLGAYIVIAPQVALSHARPEDGVNETSLSFLLLSNPVIFPNNKSVKLIITLAALNNDGHLILIRQLMILLNNYLADLLKATSENEICKIINLK